MIQPSLRAGSALSLVALVAAALACAETVPTPPERVGEPTTIPEDGPMSDGIRFQLHILEGTWDSMELGYDLDPAWALIQGGYASSIGLSLSEGDVETYDWDNQILTLNSSSSQAVVSNFAQTDEQRDHPEAALDQRVFVVLLDGTPVYGGIFLHPMSSMGIYFPVIHVESQDGQLGFILRPVQSVLEDYSAYEPDWHGIKDSGIREAFEAAGVLTP